MNIKTDLISGSTSIENGKPDAFCCNVQIAGRGIHHTKIPALVDASPDLLEALQLVAHCLENWMEIADEEDQREYDYEALRKAKSILVKWGVK